MLKTKLAFQRRYDATLKDGLDYRLAVKYGLVTVRLRTGYKTRTVQPTDWVLGIKVDTAQHRMTTTSN